MYNVIEVVTINSTLWNILVILTRVLLPIKTGQEIAYWTGDDFWTEEHGYWCGVFFRYLPIEPNVVRDMFTGLYWLADPSKLGGVWGTPGNPSLMTWDEAIDACNKLELNGHYDWRLPNLRELFSLIHAGKLDPAIEDGKFPNTKGYGYWSSSITPKDTSKVFGVDFVSGQINWDPRVGIKKYARPCRGEYIDWWWAR